MRTNKGGITNLNVGTQIICERSEQKIFLYPTFCPVAPGTLLGGGSKPTPQTSFSGEVVLLQWGEV